MLCLLQPDLRIQTHHILNELPSFKYLNARYYFFAVFFVAFIENGVSLFPPSVAAADFSFFFFGFLGSRLLRCWPLAMIISYQPIQKCSRGLGSSAGTRKASYVFASRPNPVYSRKLRTWRNTLSFNHMTFWHDHSVIKKQVLFRKYRRATSFSYNFQKYFTNISELRPM